MQAGHHRKKVRGRYCIKKVNLGAAGGVRVLSFDDKRGHRGYLRRSEPGEDSGQLLPGPGDERSVPQRV